MLDIREKTGAGLVVIEHDIPLVTAVSDELVALEVGRVIARGAPRDVINHPAVIEGYLGTSQAAIARSGRRRRRASRPARRASTRRPSGKKTVRKAAKRPSRKR